MAALWLGLTLEELQEAGPEVEGPGGRLARFVGLHPSVLIDGASDWWQTDLLEPESGAAERHRPQRLPRPSVEAQPQELSSEKPLAELAVEPKPEAAPAVAVAVEAPAPDEPPEPLPQPDPEPSEPENQMVAPAPEPDPEPFEPRPPVDRDPSAPRPTPATADPESLIHQGVVAIVEQLQAQGLLGGCGSGLALLPTEQVVIDPRRFQFRVASHHADLRGVSRWNPELAGVLSVWRDPANDQVFVVDGHHRAGLARRLGVAQLAVRFMQASSAEEARALGALINVGHGNASAFDVAKLLRDGGLTPEQVAAYGLPPSGRLIREGTALALLAPELFERAAMGGMSIDMGLALAVAGPSHTLQRDLWVVARRNCWGAASVREAAEMASLATVQSSAGDGLLPGLGLEESNLAQLLEVRAEIRNRLKGEIRALTTATRTRSVATLRAAGNTIDPEASQAARSQTQVVADTFARLVNCSGPLADLVKMLAAEVGPKRSAGAVVDEHLDLVRSAIAGELGSLGL